METPILLLEHRGFSHKTIAMANRQLMGHSPHC